MFDLQRVNCCTAGWTAMTTHYFFHITHTVDGFCVHVEGGAIGLTFNSKLTTKMCGSNLNTSPMANPIGYVHVALLPLLKKKKRGISRLDNILNWWCCCDILESDPGEYPSSSPIDHVTHSNLLNVQDIHENFSLIYDQEIIQSYTARLQNRQELLD